jgi:hypothetical protein
VLVGGALVLGWPILSHLGGLLGVIAASALAAVVYAATLLALGVSEVHAAVGLVRARLRV